MLPRRAGAFSELRLRFFYFPDSMVKQGLYLMLKKSFKIFCRESGEQPFYIIDIFGNKDSVP